MSKKYVGTVSVINCLCSTQESEVMLVCVSVMVQMCFRVFGKHASDLAWVECKKAKRIQNTP